MCGTVLCGFGGVSLCCVWESFVWVWGSEFVLCVGQFCVGLWELVCAVCGKVLCGFGGVSVFYVCGTVWCGFGGVSLCCVCLRQFGVGLVE